MAAAGVLARETLSEHGELRAYRLPDRGELLLEVLRETDGRAWQLRLPLAHAQTVLDLLATATSALQSHGEIAFDHQGTAFLGETLLGEEGCLVAVAMVEGDDRAFALWRRERVRSGWSWTIDLVLVPMALAPQLCAFARGALEQVGAWTESVPG